MNDDKVNQPKKNRVNWKILVLIVIVILIGISIAAIQEYMKSQSQKLVPIDTLSEKGKSLTGIAEKALESEGIDTRYLHVSSILERPSLNNTILRFSGTKTFNNAKIYTNRNLTDKETSAVFAADLNRYEIATYFTKNTRVKVYDKKAQVESEIWEYGKNYTLNIGNNFLDVVDSRSNKVKLKLSNYTVIQNEEQTGKITNEINKKFEEAHLEFQIDREEPTVLIDAYSNTGSILVEVGLCNSQVCDMRIEERPRENEDKNGWSESKITQRIKYFNTSKKTGE